MLCFTAERFAFEAADPAEREPHRGLLCDGHGPRSAPRIDFGLYAASVALPWPVPWI